MVHISLVHHFNHSRKTVAFVFRLLMSYVNLRLPINNINVNIHIHYIILVFALVVKFYQRTSFLLLTDSFFLSHIIWLKIILGVSSQSYFSLFLIFGPPLQSSIDLMYHFELSLCHLVALYLNRHGMGILELHCHLRYFSLIF